MHAFMDELEARFDEVRGRELEELIDELTDAERASVTRVCGGWRGVTASSTSCSTMTGDRAARGRTGHERMTVGTLTAARNVERPCLSLARIRHHGPRHGNVVPHEATRHASAIHWADACMLYSSDSRGRRMTG